MGWTFIPSQRGLCWDSQGTVHPPLPPSPTSVQTSTPTLGLLAQAHLEGPSGGCAFAQPLAPGWELKGLLPGLVAL